MKPAAPYNEPTRRSRLAAARNEEARLQFENELDELAKTWAERVTAVMDYFVKDELEQVQFELNAPQYQNSVNFKVKEFDGTDLGYGYLQMSLPVSQLSLNSELKGGLWELERPLNLLEERMSELQAKKAEALRKEREKAAALEKVRAVLSPEQMELLKLK